ncbi:hypothetical protein SLS60_001668 [Paraconiothyrium brasiliense]|uniref:Amidoligase enzyme n=1 Tax=Paraconiothyrium brasiliense TaxID=300254 RepID=A0ABR3S0I6_9PLEO
MSIVPKNDVPLQAGVEHELIFRAPDFKPTEPSAGLCDLAARLWIAKMLNNVDGISVDLEIPETKVRAIQSVYNSSWTLPYESGLKNSENRSVNPNDYYDLELASPVAEISDVEWIKQTEAIYTMFRQKEITVLAPADTCATHVHISPLVGGWKIHALKSISKAIIYYERCIDALIHKDHLHSFGCKDSNFASVLYQSDVANEPGKDWRAVWNIDNVCPRQDLMTMLWGKIGRCETKEDIVRLMCSLPENSKKLDPTFGSKPPEERESPEITRNHRWNFRPLLDERKMTHDPADGSPHVLGTVEFRQPEGSVTAEKAIGWRLFATGFVQAALRFESDNSMAEKTPTVTDLQSFVEQGVRANGCNDERVKVVFEQDSGAEPSSIEFRMVNGFEEYQITCGPLSDSGSE